jgi:hypothetical protein
MNKCRYGFIIRGATFGARQEVDAAAALVGFATLDERADVQREAYLSAFQFGADFRRHLRDTGSTKEFAGSCWAPWLWFDIDREGNIEQALRDAQRLTMRTIERYRLDDADLWVFFSGRKGFHIGLPTAIWAPEPSDLFDRIARRFCEHLAAMAGVVIDSGVYDKVRAFRAPNSQHPKTGLHKRTLSLKELLYLSADRILCLAKSPVEVAVPVTRSTSMLASADWQEASVAIERETASATERRLTGAPAKLNRLTLEIIRDGTAMLPGNRHRLLYSAAHNLAEFGCPEELAHALLTEAGLDAGLTPKEVRRQISCGIKGGSKS